LHPGGYYSCISSYQICHMWDTVWAVVQATYVISSHVQNRIISADGNNSLCWHNWVKCEYSTHQVIQWHKSHNNNPFLEAYGFII
jgi:hypothetical protein